MIELSGNGSIVQQCKLLGGKVQRHVLNSREESLVVVGAEAVHRRELANADLLGFELTSLHPHHGGQGCWNSDDTTSLRYLSQLRSRNDMSANDPTVAWRANPRCNALLQLENALVPFSKGPHLG
ncbi:hypothetical protein [Bradyrhizobium mercantei]|uniref:hypothetical protein n=1 Tax=Bradyrhizobium mercantei TaxID=1904807 RepID=UPI0013564696|nr:hypothetical protein [Bradyrhizobium mercantei]